MSSSRIFLFSKTPYPGVNHVSILKTEYYQPFIDFSSYDYIIVTSKEVFTALDKIGNWKALPVLAISESTAQYAKEIGARVLDVSEGYGKSVVELIKRKYRGLKPLYPHAKTVAFDIEKSLKALGEEANSIVVYETLCSHSDPVELPQDAICVFTSPSTVKCFMQNYVFLPTYQVVCIGETTRSALPEGVMAVVSESTSLQSTIVWAKKLIQ